MSFEGVVFQRDVKQALLELALPCNDQQLAKLEQFSNGFFKWNSIHNLSAITHYEDYLGVHLMDSLAVIAPLLQKVRLGLLPEDANMADLGTGGGFPGVLLAIFLPKMTFYLVDSIRKKTAFLEHIKGRLQLKNIHVIEQRIELFAKDYPLQMDATISRAFSELKHFVAYSKPLLKPNGLLFAMKSQKTDQELVDVQEDCMVLANEELKIPHLDAYRCLLTLQFMRKSQG